MAGDRGIVYLPRSTTFFVHLPSGNLAYPTSSAITEGTPMQVAILKPTADATLLPGVRFDDCDAPNPQRIVPTAAPATDNGKQGLDMSKNPPPPKSLFEFLPLGPWHRCGEGKFTYHLSFDKSDAIHTTFRVRPKYHVAAIVTLGYDWAKRKGFEKATDPTGMTTTVAETDEQVGAIAYIGAQWMIGGVDYEDPAAVQLLRERIPGCQRGRAAERRHRRAGADSRRGRVGGGRPLASIRGNG